MSILGARIKKLRRDLGLSQLELLEMLHKHNVEIGQSHLSNIEVASKLPSLPVLIALAKELDTSADYLLGLTDNPLSVHDIENEVWNSGPDGRLHVLLAVMPDAQKQQLLSIAETFAYGSRDVMGLVRRTVFEIGGQDTLDRFIAALRSV